MRIEELVNYFRYDYPQPTGDKPFAVSLEAAPCPWRAGHRIVCVGLAGRCCRRANPEPAYGRRFHRPPARRSHGGEGRRGCSILDGEDLLADGGYSDLGRDEAGAGLIGDLGCIGEAILEALLSGGVFVVFGRTCSGHPFPAGLGDDNRVWVNFGGVGLTQLIEPSLFALDLVGELSNSLLGVAGGGLRGRLRV